MAVSDFSIICWSVSCSCVHPSVSIKSPIISIVCVFLSMLILFSFIVYKSFFWVVLLFEVDIFLWWMWLRSRV